MATWRQPERAKQGAPVRFTLVKLLEGCWKVAGCGGLSEVCWEAAAMLAEKSLRNLLQDGWCQSVAQTSHGYDPVAAVSNKCYLLVGHFR